MTTNLPPMTDAEMREMFRNGDAVSTIILRAKARNGMGREAVRAILFGEPKP